MEVSRSQTPQNVCFAINMRTCFFFPVNDKEEHQLTDEAFTVLRFDETEKMNCYRLMSALMHM